MFSMMMMTIEVILYSKCTCVCFHWYIYCLLSLWCCFNCETIRNIDIYTVKVHSYVVIQVRFQFKLLSQIELVTYSVIIHWFCMTLLFGIFFNVLQETWLFKICRATLLKFGCYLIINQLFQLYFMLNLLATYDFILQIFPLNDNF